MNHMKKFLASLLALLMMVSCLMPATAMADTPAPTATPTATFQNVSDASGNIISLADKKTFEVKIPVDKAYTQTEADAVVWSLDWDKAKTAADYMDPDLFPNHIAGGAISDGTKWHTMDDYYWYGMDFQSQPLFTNIVCVPEEDNGQNYLKLTFSNAIYWNMWGSEDPSVAHDVGGEYMDMCGYFDLTATDNGTVLATIQDILVNPYDKFYTMQNLYKELDAMVEYAEENTDLYVAKKSMGQSSGKLFAAQDMPYLIVAKDEADVNAWLNFTEKAESDPEGVMEGISAGNYNDLAVPMMFSNIHANETAAADGIMAFTWTLLKTAASDAGTVDYTKLTGFTSAGQAKLAEESAAYKLMVPQLIEDKATFLGAITGESAGSYSDYRFQAYSDVVDLNTYYTMDNITLDVDALLDDVFFILVPEENVDGRTYLTREGSNGYDLNRDNSFQTTSETQNMQKLIGTYNPVSLMEFHGRVEGFQVEPCTPPHEPNFEYDLLSENLLPVGEAFGNAAVANNDGYNSYTMPMRDYLFDDNGTNYWYGWDDMSTSYTPQFAMLHGTIAYTVELPAYNDDTVQAVEYGCLGMADYVAAQKANILLAQTETFARGVKNSNSNEVNKPWFASQSDVEGAESDLFRPVYSAAGENGNFYPEFYIIPLDGKNQSNLDAAYQMMEWLSRNDVDILITEQEYTYDGVTYPAGTMIVTMYQAKRSVANSALYDGTFITSWDVLYSEGITSFAQTRGFDMVTVAKAGEWAQVSAVCGSMMDYADCLDYIDDNAKSFFIGMTDADVVISNASEASTAAVNALLQAGKTVGMVTDKDSEFYGDFICSYTDYLTVADSYILSATGIKAVDDLAKVITKAPTVYLTGEPSATDYGFIYTNHTSGAYEWNYDDRAMEMMNFQVTSDVNAADVIVGASALSSTDKAAVLAGTPLISYSANIHAYQSYWGSSAGLTDMVDFSSESLGGMDLLAYVSYGDKNLINGSYVMDGDDMLYSYNDNGICYFTSLPAGAEVLVKLDNSKAPTEGFIPVLTSADQTAFDTMMDGGVLGFSYKGKAVDGTNDINVALFANSLTHKVHQRDEYAYISNFIFSNMLSETAYQTAAVSTDGKVEISDDDLQDVITESNNKTEVQMPVTDTASVVMSKESIDTLAQADKAMTLDANEVTVTFDAAAVEAISDAMADYDQHTSVEISVIEIEAAELNAKQQDALKNLNSAFLLRAQILVDGKVVDEVNDFNGGKVTILIPFTPAEGSKLKDYTVIYLAEDGEITKIPTKAVAEKLQVVLEHFSTYAVVKSADLTSPDTGDSYNMTLWICLMVSASVALAGTVLCKKKVFHN
ncbi:MAG: hypothetical protein E7457_06600 [Ruminococcaceae bacterium]|nr:hypothetical protein [Oscillospiraceae bacterium]